MNINLVQNKENIDFQTPYSSRGLLYADEQNAERIEVDKERIQND
jgi:hypothetical protein